jgi:hypothetical protein
MITFLTIAHSRDVRRIAIDGQRPLPDDQHVKSTQIRLCIDHFESNSVRFSNSEVSPLGIKQRDPRIHPRLGGAGTT